MIEQTKHTKSIYNKHLSDINEARSKIICEKTFEFKTKELDEKLRDHNLSIKTIEHIQVKHNTTLINLKSKLNELLQIKSHLQTNQFKPNFFLEKTSFGHLNLLNNEFRNDLFTSQIVNEPQANDLIKLCEFNQNFNWKLIYRASQDGFGSHDFHTKCDEHKQTLTILRDKKSGFVFGGYTHETWSSSGYKWDPGAFIFILTNIENKPCKMNIKQGAISIWCSPLYTSGT